MNRRDFLGNSIKASAAIVAAPSFFTTLDFKASVTDVDESGRRITGYLAKFGNVDQHFDIIEPGAFAKSIMERGPNSLKNDIFFLHAHDWSRPHGKFEELAEDATGLKFVSTKMPNTTHSNDAIELYKEGIMVEHSIGFRTVVSEYDSDKEIRILKELYLYEGSNVTIGANRGTPFTGFKSMTPEENDAMITKIVKMLRSGRITDETAATLEIGLKQLQAHAYELGKLENAPAEPSHGGDTQKEQGPHIAAIIKGFRNEYFN